MREVATRDRIEAFLSALAREAPDPTRLFLVGGTRSGFRAQYAQIEPDLYRYPAIDPASFRQALESLLEG